MFQTVCYILCFVDRESRYNRVKESRLDARLFLSIFRQPLHVSGVSRPIIRRYNRMYTTMGTGQLKCDDEGLETRFSFGETDESI